MTPTTAQTMIGVVSDTHGQTVYTRQAIRMLEEFELELVIHCGDIGAPEIVPLFSRWPTHFVLGNVDEPRIIEPAITACGQTCHGEFGSLEVAGIKIAFLHGDDVHRLRETIRGGQWQLVCHGHTHVRKQAYEGQTLVLNPGALYRANPHSIAVVSLPELEVTSIVL